MSILSADAVQKLIAVRDAILAEPEMYDQKSFADFIDPCGSACCLAGWLVWNNDRSEFLAMARYRHANFDGLAREVLGVSCAWEVGLFGMGGCWPAQFYRRLVDPAATAKTRARAAADYINFLIERDGPKEGK